MATIIDMINTADEWQPHAEKPLLERLDYWSDAPEMRDFHIARELIMKDCGDAADEIERLREIRSGVRVLYCGGQLKQFEGEPWLARALAED